MPDVIHEMTSKRAPWVVSARLEWNGWGTQKRGVLNEYMASELGSTLYTKVTSAPKIYIIFTGIQGDAICWAHIQDDPWNHLK